MSIKRISIYLFMQFKVIFVLYFCKHFWIEWRIFVFHVYREFQHNSRVAMSTVPELPSLKIILIQFQGSKNFNTSPGLPCILVILTKFQGCHIYREFQNNSRVMSLGNFISSPKQIMTASFFGTIRHYNISNQMMYRWLALTNNLAGLVQSRD